MRERLSRGRKNPPERVNLRETRSRKKAGNITRAEEGGVRHGERSRTTKKILHS